MHLQSYFCLVVHVLVLYVYTAVTQRVIIYLFWDRIPEYVHIILFACLTLENTRTSRAESNNIHRSVLMTSKIKRLAYNYKGR